MDGVNYRSREEQADQSRIGIYKIILFTFNFLAFILACLLLGISIWMGVDRNFMTMIIGNNLYAAAVFIVLACGGIIFFISFLGCCGVVLIDERKPHSSMLFIYFICVCVMFVFLFIAGILAAVFHAQIGDSVKSTMASTLKDSYGINFQSKSNRDITDAWDKAQERLMCCAVETNGWRLYRNTSWYSIYGASDSQQLTYQDQEKRPYVPQSCCVKDKFWRYVNLPVCQTWRYGPPGAPVDGAVNRAIYYPGCYDSGVVYLKSNAGVLIGLAFIIAILLVIGIVMSALILLHLRQKNGGQSKVN